MSLDVTLYESKEINCKCGEVHITETGAEVFNANITHNLRRMADEAGIYNACWRPEEGDITQAKQMIPILKRGLKSLKDKPEEYKKFDASNGWGTYEHFVPWVEKYLNACIEYPEAIIHISR